MQKPPKFARSTVPLEEYEGECFARYLEAKKYRFTHIANEIGVSGYIWMRVNAKKVRQGLKKGYPDYVIYLHGGGTLHIEMKRQHTTLKSGKPGASPSKTSQEQLDWIAFLNWRENTEAHIAYGAKDAIRIIELCEKRFL